MNKKSKSFKLILLVCLAALVVTFQVSYLYAKKKTKPKTNKSQVTINNSKYNPANVNKKANLKVTWKNKDKSTHTVTADDGSFDSGDLKKGGSSYSKTFTTKGTYKYYCKYHSGMKGKIIVK